MKVIKILKNRFIIATLIFLGYLLIFDQYNFRAQYKLMSELSDLKEEKEFYKNELHQDSLTYHTLFNNKENIEKFARERFMMKKPHEDIFIIVRED
ncbi:MULTISPECIES: septum formation initiator family protein [unclassified Lentimicrobium]|uniref:FtsB family cell division protein n=1 Tax=unclassified Lentimicrobium TaxID=2677434 RepID=UPI0015535920|nr:MULTISPECIES: septum formation initiator family protein [unclassified Lentimicrobium]NPD44579.1 septum formation initiator family protein [Lentimicrobium sp. S6]NPD83291.1 septum formation initiator family protein [Lentimicrobium sp. L6]